MTRSSPGQDVDPDVKISVVIPTYNSFRFLKESIDSVLAQEYPAHEIIVVDGASTDGTKELCGSYGERIRFIQQASNEGVGSALNVGVRAMTGNWFKEHDADDVLAPNALQVLARAATVTPAQVVYGDFTNVDSRGRNPRVARMITPDEAEDFVVASWRILVVSHMSAMVRRTCFDAVGLYDDTLESAEDYDWFLRAVMVHGVRFYHVPVVLARYRKHRAQTTHWRRKGRIVSSTRRRTEEKVRSLIAAQADERAFAYYTGLTRRFRRIYAPILRLIGVLPPLPRRDTAGYFLSRLVPRTYNRLYWALNPPVP